jgi:hypothetical protein
VIRLYQAVDAESIDDPEHFTFEKHIAVGNEQRGEAARLVYSIWDGRGYVTVKTPVLSMFLYVP